MPHSAQHPDDAPDLTAGEAPAPVAPRRPGRESAPGPTDLPEWRARPETLPNLFLDIFDPEPDGDPLPASRQRIAAAARAREAAQTPELVNLWHDAFAPVMPEASAETTPDTTAPALDDLDRLRQMRDLLYSECPDLPPRPDTSVQMRLAVHAMNGTLVAATGPVGAALMTYSLLRGEDLRLTACAMVACGAVMTMIEFASPLI